MKAKIPAGGDEYVQIKVLSKYWFGLMYKCQVSPASTPLLSRRPFYLWFWEIKND